MNTMNKLIKHIIKTSEQHFLKPEMTFNQFIEMSYQLTCTTTYSAKYRNLEQEHHIFDRMLFDLIHVSPFTDVLGEVMMGVASFDKKSLGQCMSPPDISSLMSKLTNAYRLDHMSERKELFLSDTCGSGTGSLILSNVKEALDSKANIFNIVINDIDERMIKIAVIQLTKNIDLYRVLRRLEDKEEREFNIVAYCGNTLTDYDKPENIMLHPNYRLIADDYVRGYFNHIDYKKSLQSFETLSNRFKKTA